MTFPGAAAMSVQLELPLSFAPEAVRRHGLQAAHPRPLVSHGKRAGVPFTSWRTTPAKAWAMPELQYGHAGSSTAALILDCDNPEATAAGLSGLPPASWIVWRKANQHAHVVWALAAPVHRYPAAKIEPLRYLAHVAEFYASATGADPAYSGVLAHNPAPTFANDDFVTTWGREEPYALDQLASVIPVNWTPPKVRVTGEGRHVDLFTDLMRWAGRRENAETAVLVAAMIHNAKIDRPLPESHVRATARSVERYRARWAARGWHKPAWIAKQVALGRVGGVKSGEAKRERGVNGPKRRSATAGSNEALKPWAAEGMSRRWWYELRRRDRALIATSVMGLSSSPAPAPVSVIARRAA